MELRKIGHKLDHHYNNYIKPLIILQVGYDISPKVCIQSITIEKV